MQFTVQQLIFATVLHGTPGQRLTRSHQRRAPQAEDRHADACGSLPRAGLGRIRCAADPRGEPQLQRRAAVRCLAFPVQDALRRPAVRPQSREARQCGLRGQDGQHSLRRRLAVPWPRAQTGHRKGRVRGIRQGGSCGCGEVTGAAREAGIRGGFRRMVLARPRVATRTPTTAMCAGWQSALTAARPR